MTSPGLLDCIQIEITTKAGKRVAAVVRSGLTHDPAKKTAYRIHGLDIKTDPTVSVGRITLNEVHAPAPGGLYLVGSGLVVLAGYSARRSRRAAAR